MLLLIVELLSDWHRNRSQMALYKSLDQGCHALSCHEARSFYGLSKDGKILGSVYY